MGDLHLSQPGSFIDPLTEVLRDGARALLAQAVEAEVATLLSRYAVKSCVMRGVTFAVTFGVTV